MDGFGKDGFSVSWFMAWAYFDGSLLTLAVSPLKEQVGKQMDQQDCLQNAARVFDQT